MAKAEPGRRLVDQPRPDAAAAVTLVHDEVADVGPAGGARDPLGVSEAFYLDEAGASDWPPDWSETVAGPAMALLRKILEACIGFAQERA